MLLRETVGGGREKVAYQAKNASGTCQVLGWRGLWRLGMSARQTKRPHRSARRNCTPRHQRIEEKGTVVFHVRGEMRSDFKMKRQRDILCFHSSSIIELNRRTTVYPFQLTLIPSFISISVASTTFFRSLTVRPSYGATAAVKNMRFLAVEPARRFSSSAGWTRGREKEDEESGESRRERTVAEDRARLESDGGEERDGERDGGMKKMDE